jgi:hypothetical protein
MEAGAGINTHVDAWSLVRPRALVLGQHKSNLQVKQSGLPPLRERAHDGDGVNSIAMCPFIGILCV